MAKMLRTAYGESLVKLAAANDRVVVCDADVAAATMTNIFKKSYPDRFFDFGIAEENMVCAATGMAHSGLIPFVSTFAIFGAGRAYEQVRNAVAYSNANVKLACTHPGISVGEDGGTHQAIEDISLMRTVPNMTVLSPCDCIETEKAVFKAAELEGPVYIRISRQASPDLTDPDAPFEVGKASVLRKGTDICVMATGLLVNIAMDAAKVLETEGISVEIANMSSLKPIDEEYILSANQRFRGIVTAEEHSVIGGLGSAVADVLAGHPGARFYKVGVEDKFGRSGDPEELFEVYGLTKEHISKACRKLMA